MPLKIRERERERKRDVYREERRHPDDDEDDEGMADNIMELLSSLGASIKGRSDDDGVDRLSRRYTTCCLVLCAMLVSTKHYVGEPISCWVPAQFTANHEEYTDKVCWVSNTYHLPARAQQVPEPGDPARHKINYYQWVPMILLAQAVLFYLPCILWRVLNRGSGLNLHTVIDTARSSQWGGAGSETRDKTLRFAINHLDAYLSAGHRPLRTDCWHRITAALAKRCVLVIGKTYGNYLACLYLVCKLLYIANAIGQIFMLSFFFGTDYHYFGVHIIIAMWQGSDWRASVRFPRVTLCDFEIRHLGNVHRHTVQCVLPINLFNEKIFVFLWFWFALVAIISSLSLLLWLVRSMNRAGQDAYVLKQLQALDKVSPGTELRTRAFTRDYLRQDGLFVVRMVAVNAGDVMAAEVTAGLWDVYLRQHCSLLLPDNTGTTSTLDKDSSD